MNLTKNSTYYSRILKNPLIWYFQIPVNQIQLEEDGDMLKEIQKKILNFNIDYIQISAKYELAQILGKDFLNLINKDLESIYIEFQKSEFERREVTTILPSIGSASYGNKNYSNFQASKLFYHDHNDNVVSEEIYDLFGLKNLNKSLKDDSNVDTPVIEVDNSLFTKHIDHSKFSRFSESQLRGYKEKTYPLYFSLSLMTNLFHDRLYFIEHYKIEPWMKTPEFKGIDNTTLALQNAPRFNSFLRDLTKIWVQKYQWEVISPIPEDSSKRFNSKGIKINNSLIYLEDL